MLHAKFKLHTTSLGSDQELKIEGCLNHKILRISFKTMTLLIYEMALWFLKVRNPKSKNKGNLGFLVVYDLSDSQRWATCMKRPNNLLKRNLTMKNNTFQYEIRKRNKTGTTIFYNVCNSLLSNQIPSSHKANKLPWYRVSGTPGPIGKNNYWKIPQKGL